MAIEMPAKGRAQLKVVKKFSISDLFATKIE